MREGSPYVSGIGKAFIQVRFKGSQVIFADPCNPGRFFKRNPSGTRGVSLSMEPTEPVMFAEFAADTTSSLE